MKVLLAFNDRSLGGTSRTAFEFVRLWRTAGAEVSVYCPDPPHETRAKQLQELSVRVVDSISTQVLKNFSLIHLHHAAPSGATVKWVTNLIDQLPDPSPIILTHNIFGQNLGVEFPSNRTIIGLLGHWLAQQYKMQSWQSRNEICKVIPNAQNLEFFRPPSPSEKKWARSRRGIEPDAVVILRVGSPSLDKWAIKPYLMLARRVISSPNLHLRLVGCPTALKEALPQHPRIVVLPPTENDDCLREEYWSADIFSHWANRGESFGNVLLEALGTGLPVRYKARPLRDNTPWEFRDKPGFRYICSRQQWVVESTRSEIVDMEERQKSIAKYSSSYLGRLLAECVARVEVAPPQIKRDLLFMMLCETFDSPINMPLLQRVHVYCRHNPVSFLVKTFRWRLVALTGRS